MGQLITTKDLRGSIIPPSMARRLGKKPPEKAPEPPQISLHQFVLDSWGILNPGVPIADGWHIRLICEHLEAVSAGEIPTLLINIPPRHLKSTIVTICYPCWEWLYSPWLQFLCLSYSALLANDHSDKRRDVIGSDWYQELSQGRCKFKSTKNRLSEFGNISGGAMISRGLDGTVTGVGGHRIIFDDPNNPGGDDADNTIDTSKTRKNELAKFKNFSINRRNDPNAPVIVIQQRTHTEDVSGYICDNLSYRNLILTTEAEQDEVFVFPRSGEIIERRQGELLQPDRFGSAQAIEAKATLGSYGWASFHQQRPVPLGGEILKLEWLERYIAPPTANIDLIAISIDTAQKKGKLNDPWAMTVWAIVGKEFYLLEVVCNRFNYPEGKARIELLCREWEPDWVLIEDTSAGASVCQDLQRDASFPWNIIPVSPRGDKMSRFILTTATFESRRVYLPESAPWLANYERELLSFPRAPHDDQVDATSQFLNWAKFRLPKAIQVPVPKKSIYKRVTDSF
jgi:predicted phage terminase large subunit-like protein